MKDIFIEESATDREARIAEESLHQVIQLDHRSAVRYLYLSALLTLEERALLQHNRSQTNREYLRSVAHVPHLAARLSRVIDVFERVWYGYHAIDETAYARYRNWVIELGREK